MRNQSIESVIEACISHNHILQKDVNGVKICLYHKRLSNCEFQDEKITTYNKDQYHICKAIKDYYHKVIQLG